jgi:motility quorum-sensing regulator/GCU-specific mRNA interferase toxin
MGEAEGVRQAEETFADHRVLQDVYPVPANEIVLYVKFQADEVTEFRVMALKEK